MCFQTIVVKWSWGSVSVSYAKGRGFKPRLCRHEMKLSLGFFSHSLSSPEPSGEVSASYTLGKGVSPQFPHPTHVWNGYLAKQTEKEIVDCYVVAPERWQLTCMPPRRLIWNWKVMWSAGGSDNCKAHWAGVRTRKCAIKMQFYLLLLTLHLIRESVSNIYWLVCWFIFLQWS